MRRLLRTLAQFENWKNGRVHLFDMGFENSQLNEIREICPGIEIEKFDVSAEIPWCDLSVNAGFYAWKPVMIQRVMERQGTDVLWLDSSVIVRRRLWRIRDELLRRGFYASRWPGFLTGRSTAAHTIHSLNAHKEAELPMSVAAVVGFAANHNPSRQLLDEWVRLSTNPDVNNPPGANLSTHKGDQSILSILVHRYDLFDQSPGEADCGWLDFFIDNHRASMFREDQA